MDRVLSTNHVTKMNLGNMTFWTARILGLMLAGLVLLFLIGNGIAPSMLTPATAIMMIVFLASAIGMLVIWRSQLVGGLMVIGGMSMFYFTELATAGHFPGGWVLPLCFVPGALALVSWSINRWKQRS